MAKHLKLGSDPQAGAWTLPDYADVDKIRAEIASAMEEEDAVAIQVVVGKNQNAELLVNGSALVAALVWEDTPAGGGMTIID